MNPSLGPGGSFQNCVNSPLFPGALGVGVDYRINPCTYNSTDFLCRKKRLLKQIVRLAQLIRVDKKTKFEQLQQPNA